MSSKKPVIVVLVIIGVLFFIGIGIGFRPGANSEEEENDRSKLETLAEKPPWSLRALGGIFQSPMQSFDAETIDKWFTDVDGYSNGKLTLSEGTACTIRITEEDFYDAEAFKSVELTRIKGRILIEYDPEGEGETGDTELDATKKKKTTSVVASSEGGTLEITCRGASDCALSIK